MSKLSSVSLSAGIRRSVSHSVTSTRVKVKKHLLERLDAEALYGSTHDELTGLYNRRMFCAKARELLDATPGERYCLLVSNVHDFKMVNDVYGRHGGDKLLMRIATALRFYKTDGMVYGRVGADKFCALIREDDFDRDMLEASTNHIIRLDRNTYYPILVHIGVYVVEDKSLPVETMIDRAHMAIDGCGSNANRRVRIFDNSVREQRVWSHSIIGSLEDALHSGDIMPYLQPQVDETGAILGAELLVRWNHRDRGFLSPSEFVPILEYSGLITKVDDLMWEHACRMLGIWQMQGRDDLTLSVNVSAKDFLFTDVRKRLVSLVNRYGVDPSHLRLEITETAMMTDIESRLVDIKGLQAEGFVVEMDDFGSAYSSLNMLREIPVDVLKIDMLFLREATEHERARIILQSVIDLSRKLHISAITEGVETVEQFEMLKQMGCKIFQGFYFAKPMPVSSFELLCGLA